MDFIQSAVAHLLPKGGYKETGMSIEYTVMFGCCAIRVRPLEIYTVEE
jgi:hypothetical protein